MNLISCGHCGVVLDKDRIKEPELDLDNDNLDENYVYTYVEGDEDKNYHVIIKCPACKKFIIHKNGQGV